VDPFFPIPFGWFSLGHLDALDIEPPPLDWVEPRAHTVASRIRALGRELVAWQAPDGLVVADAYCPHQGAHLGVGGEVVDGCLVCPLHERRFRADGRLAESAGRTDDRRTRLRTYPITPADGLLWCWFHPDPAIAPRWAVEPSLDGLSVVATHSAVVLAPWQDVAAEQFEHRVFRPLLHHERRDDGIRRRWSAERRFASDHAVFPASLESVTTGPGHRVTTMDLMGAVVLLCAITPLDDVSTRVRVVVARSDDRVPALVGGDIAAAVDRELLRMAAIWEHQRRDASAEPPRDERGSAAFRRWAEQFTPSIR
jgi:nitrite reductase/ring-hydroxylating ferredoxin subunit